MSKISVVIMAAGLGKRMMNPGLPKVLVELENKPLLGYVIELALKLNSSQIVAIVGHHREMVIDYMNRHFPGKVEIAVQEQQLGTGHAVMMTKDNLAEFDGNVLILSGDVPLIKSSTLESFLRIHFSSLSDLSVLTTKAPNPKGYGRIVRSGDGIFERIVEEKDADDEIRAIDEINSGVYLCDNKLLFDCLEETSNQNAQNEYYLTNIIEIALKKGKGVNAFPVAEFEELQGINSPQDLKKAKQYLERISND